MSLVRRRSPLFKVLGLLVALMVVLAACGGDDEPTTTDAGDDTGTETEAEADAGGGGEAITLEITAMDNSFDPSTPTAPAGSEVTVELTNEGQNPHTFTIDDPAADTSTVDGGDSGTATFTMPDSPVLFYCAIHGEEAMSGTLEPE